MGSVKVPRLCERWQPASQRGSAGPLEPNHQPPWRPRAAPLGEHDPKGAAIANSALEGIRGHYERAPKPKSSS